jgi:predicted aspartyl protease
MGLTGMKRSWGLNFGLLLIAAIGCPRVSTQVPVIEPSMVEIPFEFVRGAIVVQATVNGKGRFSMLLDTGADPSIVDLDTAKSIGLEVAAQGDQGSGGGKDANPAYETSLPTVQLDSFTATNVAALAMDLSKISTALGRTIGGVLGYSLLKSRIVQIDYPNRKVRFMTKAPSCAEAVHLAVGKCTTLSFRYKNDILAAGVEVNGKRVTANFDTGSNGTFQVTPSAVEKLRLGEEVARAHPTSSMGFNGALKNQEGTVRNVRVGTISVNEPTVVFYGKGMGMDKEPWDLRVGNGFLKDFVLTLDFQHGRILLTVP